MTRSTLFGRALCSLLLGSAVLAAGCPGLPCECNSEVIPLPDEGAWEISDIRVEDHYNGGGSESWDWNHASPWGDVIEGELRMEGGRLFVEYSTEHGTFLVELEQSDSEGF